MKENGYLLEKKDETSSGYVVKLNVSDYRDLFFIQSDLLKVILLAIEAEGDSSSKYIVDSRSNIKTLLEIVLQLIPFQEATVLDEIILKKKNNL